MKDPTIHDFRATAGILHERDEDYVEKIVKSVNPHNSPKKTLQELFPSAKINILKGGVEIPEDFLWECCQNGCDFESPIVTLELIRRDVNVALGVVTKIKCCPVLTCPKCLSQEVIVWEDK